MPNLTVSSAVDTFMQAADQAGMQAALGQVISNPDVGYARSDGNDTTGDGSIDKPYRTAQKLMDAGFELWDLGNGTFGDVVISASNFALWIRGIGSYSSLGTFTIGPGLPSTAEIWDIGYWSFSIGAIDTRIAGITSKDINLHGVLVGGDIILSGSNGISTGENGTNAGNGLLDGACRIVGSVYADGGAGAAGDGGTAGGNGGNGGGFTITGPCTIGGSYSAVGGAGGADGGGGAGSAGTDGAAVISGAVSVPTPSIGSGFKAITGSIVNGTFIVSSAYLNTTVSPPTSITGVGGAISAAS